MARARILIVDDEANARSALAELLREDGYVVETAADGFKAIGKLADFNPDVVLTDLKMPGMSGLELLEKARARDPHCVVLVATAYGAVDSAVAAMRAGAADFLGKPVDVERLSFVLSRELERRELRREAEGLRARLRERRSLGRVVGSSPAMQRVVDVILQVAGTQASILITGESGTGKELIASAIHEHSPRSGGPFVTLNCSALTGPLLETELFGYEKGAFTGAMSTKLGRVEQSHNGTLFLDEVGSLDLGVQSKLLQVLQDGTFVRVGGHEPRSIATRLVSASNTDLRNQVEDGTFRLDFLFRINAVTINLPPLRQRIADLPVLIDYFIEHYAKIFHNTPELLSKSAVRLMQNYHWPGNIRQLENLIRSYVLIGSEEALVAELMPETPRNGITTDIDLSEPVSLKNITKKATQDLERQIILKVLQENSWNRQKTAKWLQISYRSLLYKLSEVGMPEVPPRPLRMPHLVKKEERTLKPAAVSSRTRIY